MRTSSRRGALGSAAPVAGRFGVKDEAVRVELRDEEALLFDVYHHKPLAQEGLEVDEHEGRHEEAGLHHLQQQQTQPRSAAQLHEHEFGGRDRQGSTST